MEEGEAWKIDMTHTHCETVQYPCGSREIFQSLAIALWEVQTNLLCHPWLQSSDTFFFLLCVLDFAEGTWYVPLITLLKEGKRNENETLGEDEKKGGGKRIAQKNAHKNLSSRGSMLRRSPVVISEL